jgi:regulator of PEP synthase PpsR (kinase-PPPase family)
VEFMDSWLKANVCRTYSTEKIANGVANRYRREGREVLGVHEYSAEEVAAAVAEWRSEQRRSLG